MLCVTGLCEWPEPHLPPTTLVQQQGLQHRLCCTTKSLFITLGFGFGFFFATFPLRGKPDPVQETGGLFTRGPFLLLARALEVGREEGVRRCSGCTEGELKPGAERSACSGDPRPSPLVIAERKRVRERAVGACVGTRLGQPSPPPRLSPSALPRLIPGRGRRCARGRVPEDGQPLSPQAAPSLAAAAQGTQRHGWVASAPMLLLQLQ